MRELKMRVWDKDYGKMIIPDMVEFKDGKIDCVIVYNNEFNNIEADEDSYYSIPPYFSYENFEVLEYTGLKDKNGKEIYVGYIVMFGAKKCEVIWWPDRCAFKLKHVAGTKITLFDCCPDQSYKIAVIGNVYENPELLK
jgi:hypothetical protein